ncbi:unnamed protein product [Adineta ricciae]|uniref:Uncharacterized protein n=1 Tax=Adineta ricciae TaxID=249248 RepID=A0A813XBG8_ADIRI|nr:unnamed protein product [Adineta ricciae]CAF1317505.1 unnamed protein product [Adineta ricciae]
MCHRSLLLGVFVLLFANTWSLRCYEGNGTHCKLSADSNEIIPGVGYLCIRYNTCVQMTDLCDDATLNSDKFTWQYLIADQAGCDYISKATYTDVTCCSTDRCNAPLVGKCLEN